MIRGLSHSHEVHLFALKRTSISESRVGAVTPYLASLRTESLSVRSRWLGALGVVASPTLLQVGYFRNRKAMKEIGEAISRIDPEVIVCQTVRMAEYVPERTPALRVLDFMDAFSLRAKTRSDFHRGPPRWFWKLESGRLRRFERTVSNRFDVKIIICQNDLEWVDPYRQLNLEVVPNGVDSVYFSPADSSPTFDIGFIGGLDYAPNIDAARLLVRKIAPRISAGRKCKVLLAGRKPTWAVRRLEGASIAVHANPPDVRASYSSCRVVAVPTRFGSGIQTKILETLAMGVPCVATSEAVLSLGIPSPEMIRTADSCDEFVTTIEGLLENPDGASLQAQRGRKWVVSQFRWEDSVAQLEALLLRSRGL